MISPGRSYKRWFAVELLAVLALILCTPWASLSQEKKKEDTSAVAKAPSTAPSQKGGAVCAKSATEAQVTGIAAKIREFQAKQQAKANKNQPKPAEQATNRKP